MNARVLFLDTLFYFIGLYVCPFVSTTLTFDLYIPLQYVLKSGNVSPVTLFFLLKTVVTIPQFHKGLLCFHIHFSISLSISALLPPEGSCDFDRNCIKSIDKFEGLAL